MEVAYFFASPITPMPGGIMADTVVYRASKIITMDPNRPEATHVAVREGRILAVGGDEIAAATGGRIDDGFARGVLMPGFVEGHAHMMTGAMWRYCYIGYQDRVDPDGRLWKGAGDIGSVIAALKDAEKGLAPGEPLVAWGFDPIFLPTERLYKAHLDAVSSDRPIAVIHSNFHLMTVNSPARAMAGYDRTSSAEGVARGPDGEPNGELQEMAAMFPVMRRLGIDLRALARRPESMRAFAKTAMRAGVTTSADLLSELAEEDIDVLLGVAAEEDFPLRIVAVLSAMSGTPGQVAARAAALGKRSSDRLRMGAVKIVTDGSIQGYTARLKWPGYVTGHPNGIWNVPPAQLDELVATLHAAGIQMHIHVNGDEASEAALDALDRAMRNHGRGDHRHTLQHCQMAGEDQFRRMAALGLCVNLFANHIWYFGDQHWRLTIGPDRAMRMDACRSALDHGIPLAIHSDAPVTPMGPLHVAWCAVNRKTPSGRTLGENQRITVDEALFAITTGAAHTLRLDHEIGSIETGKKADFTVLAADPLGVPPIELKDVPVLGTVVGGRHFPV
jgi:predicted amidohydrolase YtcJ